MSKATVCAAPSADGEGTSGASTATPGPAVAGTARPTPAAASVANVRLVSSNWTSVAAR
ncbi:hypothetical protein [Streptomyces viridochromogenes]|uniref:hypothetical protein n=1 Tax=Streptomyces viridochromogenes TaxID=1938 RepID=UPI0018FE4F2B|nr:hypothetical protein [Streptomyces viridochromogenes]